MISWDEAKYNADNTKGWTANKNNDEAKPPNNLIGMHQH